MEKYPVGSSQDGRARKFKVLAVSSAVSQVILYLENWPLTHLVLHSRGDREVVLSYFSEWWLMTEPLGLPILTSRSVIIVTFVKKGNLNSPAPLLVEVLNCHLGHVKSKKKKCETFSNLHLSSCLLKWLLLSPVLWASMWLWVQRVFFQSLFFELRRSPSMKPARYLKKKMKIQKNIW